MLSPPYSPYPGKEEGRGVIAATVHDHVSRPVEGRAQASRVPAAHTTSDSATAVSSLSVSSDELTDNDYSSEEGSGTAPPEALSRSAARKRAASEAFLDMDENDADADHHSRNLRQRRMTTCWDALKTDPARYLRQERSLLGLYPLRRHSWAGPSSNMGGLAEEGAESSTSATPGRGRGRRAHRTNSGAGSGSSSGATSRRGRRSALQVEPETCDDTQEEQSPKKSSQVRVHDLSLNQIEDFSPPLSSLPPGKSLRAEWKGAPMDLSNDPELHLLHPAEAHLASVLRLPCEVYLDSKRRLFAEKVHRMRQGLPFRRTDSQKACRIDVNKASRLFGAFERIGWLDDILFQKHAE